MNCSEKTKTICLYSVHAPQRNIAEGSEILNKGRVQTTHDTEKRCCGALLPQRALTKREWLRRLL